MGGTREREDVVFSSLLKARIWMTLHLVEGQATHLGLKLKIYLTRVVVSWPEFQ